MASNKPSTDSSLIIGDEKITIRNMQLKDVSECYDLGISLFAFSSSLSRTFDRFVVIESYSSESEFCFVATAQDKIIGFVLGTQLAKQQIIGYIGWIAVRRDYQRKGIGSTLVSLLEARMRERGIAEFLVDTPVSNLAAIKFLVQLGFGAPVKQVYMSRNFRQTKKGIAPIHVGDPIQIESPSRDPNVNAHKKPGEVTIRRMGINDIWPVYQIGETVFTETAVNLYRFWDEAQVTDAYESDGELALVAEVDGKVAGFALGSTLERIETKYGYLIWLAVDPSAHGLGIGSLLYRGYEQIIKEEFEDIDTIIIDTQASNHGAIRFFSRIGFEITDTFIYICKKVNQQHKEATEAIQQVMELIENSVGIEGTK